MTFLSEIHSEIDNFIKLPIEIKKQKFVLFTLKALLFKTAMIGAIISLFWLSIYYCFFCPSYETYVFFFVAGLYAVINYFTLWAYLWSEYKYVNYPWVDIYVRDYLKPLQ
jgi:hypothetical protein